MTDNKWTQENKKQKQKKQRERERERERGDSLCACNFPVNVPFLLHCIQVTTDSSDQRRVEQNTTRHPHLSSCFTVVEWTENDRGRELKWTWNQRLLCVCAVLLCIYVDEVHTADVGYSRFKALWKWSTCQRWSQLVQLGPNDVKRSEQLLFLSH